MISRPPAGQKCPFFPPDPVKDGHENHLSPTAFFFGGSNLRKIFIPEVESLQKVSQPPDFFLNLHFLPTYSFLSTYDLCDFGVICIIFYHHRRKKHAQRLVIREIFALRALRPVRVVQTTILFRVPGRLTFWRSEKIPYLRTHLKNPL